MNPLLLPGDWLIQPEALRSMALAVRAFNERGGSLPQSRPQSPLLTVQDGIGTVAIKGPILRKAIACRVGMRITANLTNEEWQQLATSIREVATAIAFIIGDWLVYGQGLFGLDGFPDRRVDEPSYQLAIAATGLDRSTLQSYAYVSRNIPHSLRSERLSWEHHRLLAKLPVAEIGDWVARCLAEEDAGRKMSTRRLRKSLALGRIATAADMEPDAADKGIVNHIPFVNRLVLWWRHMQEERFLVIATREQRAAMKRDLEPIIHIYNQL